MDAFIGQRFEDFETIAGVNVIKLYGDYLLPVRMGMCLVREILVRLVALVIVPVSYTHLDVYKRQLQHWQDLQSRCNLHA